MKKSDFKLLAIALAVLTAIFLIVFLCGGNDESFVEQTYTVRTGDSLDKLYYKYGSGNLEKWRYEVKRLNDMEESGLYAGEEIVILVSGGKGTWK